METNGRAVSGHAGDTLAFHSVLVLLPKEGVGIFVANNTETGAAAIAETYEAFMDHFFPAEPPPVVTPTRAGAARYVGFYRSTRQNISTFEKLMSIAATRVTLNDDGTLSVDTLRSAATGELRRWVEVEPGVFRDRDSADRLSFQEHDGSVSALFLSRPFAGYLRLPWYQEPMVQFGMLGVPPLIFFATLIGLAGGAVVRTVRREASPLPAVTQVRHWLAWCSGMNMLFVASFAALLMVHPLWGVIFHRSLLLYGVLALGILAGAGSIGLVALATYGWRRRIGGLVGRTGLIITAIAGLLFVTALVQWNLLGFFV